MTTIRWKVLISWFYVRKNNLANAMMTVELVWPWRRRRGTCLFVYLFVSHGKGDQKLLCLLVCCLFAYSHGKYQQIRTLLFYYLPQRRRPKTSLFVCLFVYFPWRRRRGTFASFGFSCLLSHSK